MSEELLGRLTRATRASPDGDGMILVPPEMITETVELLSYLIERLTEMRDDLPSDPVY